MAASPLLELPRVPWADFMRAWTWNAGEHLTVVGPTGTGKTTLLRACLVKRYEARGRVVVLATKPRDRNLSAWAREDGLHVARSWPPAVPWYRQTPADVAWPGVAPVPWDHRVMLWPHLRHPDDVPNMAEQHRRALGELFAEGAACVVAEELWYLCERLGLAELLKEHWSQGRSLGLTLAGATQRPVDIPLLAYSSATHLFFFGDNDEVNLRRIQGLGGLSSQLVRDTVRALPFHDVLYVNTRRRVVIRTRVAV